MIIKKIYKKLRNYINNIFGTKISEYYWKNRQGYNWIKKGYWKGKEHSHRDYFLDKILKLNPNKILEIGSNCGPNLLRLYELSSKLTLVGIDINQNAINYGNKKFKEKGYNINLLKGYADDLSNFKDNSFDIIFTDAVLIYIGKDKIIKTIKEFKRVGKKYLVFLELYKKDDSGLGIYKNNWVRNYKKLMVNYLNFNNNQIQIEKLPSSLWGGNWGEDGYIIIIKL